MKIKTSELTDRALDWAVVSIECARPAPFKSIPAILNGTVRIFRADIGAHSMPVSPSTDWAQGGPIIEREEIELVPKGMHWDAYADEDFHVPYSGPTPLIAAMRCYVASKLGDTVQVPADLI